MMHEKKHLKEQGLGILREKERKLSE